MSFDEAISNIGWGKYQIRNIAFCHVHLILTSFHVLSHIFVAYPMPHTCSSDVKNQVEKICNITLNDNQTKLLIPTKVDSADLNYCLQYSNPLPPNATAINCEFGENDFAVYSNQTTDCTKFVFTSDGTVQSSIIAQYEMICNKSWHNYLLQSLFMVGVLLNGMVLGKASDRIGRRKVLLLMTVGTMISSFAITFANSFPLYAALRTVVGFFCFISPTSKVLVTETTKTNKRALVINVAAFGFSSGTIILVVIAYFVKYWQTLQMLTSVSLIGGLVIWWYLDESARWLAARGRKKDAIKILEKIAKFNKVENPESLQSVKESLLDDSVGEKTKPINLGMTDTFRTPQLRKLTLVLTYCWFATSCAFYGLTLNVASVGGNIYLTTVLMGLMAVPAYPLALYLCQKVGRRFVISTSFILAGLFCSSMYFIPPELKALHITMFLMGRVFTLIPFSTLYLYSIELNPTVIRSTAVNYGSSWARVGAIIAPVIAMTELIHPTLPFIIFGLVTVLAGILVLLLPETRKVAMLETFEEADSFLTENSGPLQRLLCGRKNLG